MRADNDPMGLGGSRRLLRAGGALLAAALVFAASAAPARADVGGWSSSSWTGCAGGTNSGSWDDSGLVYVPCGSPSVIGAYDEAGHLVRSIPTGRTVTDVAPTRDGRYLYLAGPGPLVRLARQGDGNYALDEAWSARPYSMYGQSVPASGGHYVSTDAAGNVYYADGTWGSSLMHTVVQYAPDGTVVTRFGEWASSWQRGTFYWALAGVAASDDGTVVYTVEIGNNRIQRWERQPSGAFVAASTFGSTVANNPTREGFCDYGAWRGTFAAPYDVALDAAGNVYVMNTTCKQVLGFTPDLGALRLSADVRVAGGDYPRPHGFAVGRDGSVFVGENQRVLHPAGAAHPADGTAPVLTSSGDAAASVPARVPTSQAAGRAPDLDAGAAAALPVVTDRPRRPAQVADRRAPRVQVRTVTRLQRALRVAVRCDERCLVALVARQRGQVVARRTTWLHAGKVRAVTARLARTTRFDTLRLQLRVTDAAGNVTSRSLVS